MRLWILGLAGVSLWAQQARDKEAALGAQLAKEMRAGTTALENVAVGDYVEQLGQKLAIHFPDPVHFTFSVIGDQSGARTHEPVSFPGGYVFVGADLISAAQDEAEFAGMLAHAMAHSAAPVTPRGVVNYGSVPLVFIGGWSGSSDYAVPLAFLRVQRAAELDADLLGVQVMAKTGFDPNALVRYIDRTQADDRSVRQVFSTLPPRASRIAALEQVIQRLPPKAYSVSEDFQIIQDAVRTSEPTRVRPAPSLLRPDERP